MSKKPPDPPRDAAGKDSAEGSSRDTNDSTAPQGIPAVSRDIEIAADAALGSMRVSFARSSGPEHERRTLPPPVPMEQLVERMMLADSDRAPPPDIKPIISSTSGDSNPPGSDVDTVRTRMADMQRVPLSPAPASAPLDDVPAAVPYPHDADTLPPAHIADDTEPGFRPLMTDSPPAPTAIDTAGAVLEEFGVEFFKGRPIAKDVPPEEQPRLRPVEDVSRPKVADDRRRPSPNARLTPPRTIRPNPDAVPPSSSTGRSPPTRKRNSEPGHRMMEHPPPSSDRLGAVTGSINDRMLDVRQRYESGDHRGALRIAESILFEQSDHLAALSYAESSRQMLRQKYLARIRDMAVVPRIKHVAIELARVGIDTRDARVVDAIDGVLSVEEIVVTSGLSTLDVLRVLHDLVVDGLVEFVGPAAGRR